MISQRTSRMTVSKAEYDTSKEYECDSIPDDYQLPGWNESEKLKKIKIFVASNEDKVRVPSLKGSVGHGNTHRTTCDPKMDKISWQRRISGSFIASDEDVTLQVRHGNEQSMNASKILRGLESIRRRYQGRLQNMKHLPPGDVTCLDYLQTLQSEGNYQLDDKHNLRIDEQVDNSQPTLCELKEKVRQLEIIYSKLDDQVQGHHKYPNAEKPLINVCKSDESDTGQLKKKLAKEKMRRREALSLSKSKTENSMSNQTKSLLLVNHELKSQVKVLHNKENKLTIAHSKEIHAFLKKQKEMKRHCDLLLKQNTTLKAKLQSQIQEKKSCVKQGLPKSDLELKSAVAALKKELKEYKQHNSTLEEKLRVKSNAYQVLEKNLKECKNDLVKYHQTIDNLKSERDILSRHKDKKQSSLKNKEKDDTKSVSKEDDSDNKEMIISLNNNLKRVTDERDELKQKVKSTMKSTMKMEQQISSLQLTLQKAECREKDLVSEIDIEKAATANTEKQNAELQKKVKELEKKNDEFAKEICQMRKAEEGSNDREMHHQIRSDIINEIGDHNTMLNGSQVSSLATIKSLQDRFEMAQQELEETQNTLKLSENKLYFLNEENEGLRKLVIENQEKNEHLQHVQKEHDKLTLESGSKTLKLKEYEEYIDVLKKRIDKLSVNQIVQAESKIGDHENIQNLTPTLNVSSLGEQKIYADSSTQCTDQNLKHRYEEIQKILIEVKRARDAKISEPENLDPATLFSNIHTAFLNRDDQIRHLLRINQRLVEEVGTLKNNIKMLKIFNQKNSFNDSGYDCQEHTIATSSHALDSLHQASGITVKEKAIVDIAKAKGKADEELMNRHLQSEDKRAEAVSNNGEDSNDKEFHDKTMTSTMAKTDQCILENQEVHDVLLASQTIVFSTKNEDLRKDKEESYYNQSPTSLDKTTKKNFEINAKCKNINKRKAKAFKQSPELSPIRGAPMGLLKKSLSGSLLPLPSPAKIEELIKGPNKSTQDVNNVLKGKPTFQEKSQQKKSSLEDDNDIKAPKCCPPHHMKIKEKLKLDEEEGEGSEIADEDLNDLIDEILLN